MGEKLKLLDFWVSRTELALRCALAVGLKDDDLCADAMLAPMRAFRRPLALRRVITSVQDSASHPGQVRVNCMPRGRSRRLANGLRHGII